MSDLLRYVSFRSNHFFLVIIHRILVNVMLNAITFGHRASGLASNLFVTRRGQFVQMFRDKVL